MEMLARNLALSLLALVLLSGMTVSAITVEESYADQVVYFDIGDAPHPAASFSDPNAALSPLGWVSLGTNSVLVVEFLDYMAINGTGADILVAEVMNGDALARISVSADGQAWYTYAEEFSGHAYLDLDVAGLAYAAYVKIEGLNEGGGGQTPGYDLAYVRTLNADVRPVATSSVPVPEPATLALLGGGLVALLYRRRT